MKKIFTLLAALVVGGAVASAQGEESEPNVLHVGEGQTYTTLKAALDAAQDGDVIEINSDLTMRGKDERVTLSGADNLTIKSAEGNTYTISCAMRNNRVFTVYKTATIENLNFVWNDGGSNAVMIESGKSGSNAGNLTLKNCKISNFDTTSGQGVICAKSGGKVTLENVIFSNNKVDYTNQATQQKEDRGEVYFGSHDSMLKGTTNCSVTVQNDNRFKVENFEPEPRTDGDVNLMEAAPAANAINLYFDGTRTTSADKPVVVGTEDLSKFNLMTKGYKLVADEGNNKIYAVADIDTGIAGVEADENAPVEYYNLNGVQVKADNMTPGVYVRRQGKNVTKVMVK